ncbi:transposase [Candidatus Jordarchaeum sp.]|uniref:transposase n=1 Tax=Candidatus Jordarchaeum sp. TaxID=2823881 RepID=UPI00404918DB
MRRDRLEDAKKEVNKKRFLVLKNAKNLSDKERAELEEFLEKYPQFQQFATLLNEVRTAIRSERDEGMRRLGEIEVREEWGSSLQAAVRTIKGNAEKLLNYRTVKKPSKECVNVNPEWMVRPFRTKTKKCLLEKILEIFEEEKIENLNIEEIGSTLETAMKRAEREGFQINKIALKEIYMRLSKETKITKVTITRYLHFIETHARHIGRSKV